MRELAYTIDGYVLDVQARFEDARGEVGFQWQADGRHNEKGLEWERQRSSIYYREQGRGRDYLYEGRDDDTEIEDPVEWVAFKQNYFSAIVGSDVGFNSGKLRSLPPVDEADTTINMRFGMDVTLPTADIDGREIANVKFYFGPNMTSAASSTTGWGEIGRVIDFGWWIFGWINRNLIFPTYTLLAGYIGSAGLIVLVMTLLIKSVLFPITWKNYLSSAKMKVLKPDIQEINDKFPDQEDAMQRQQETMKLYRESGVNPLAGCIPQLIQAPLLYAMFRFFPANIELRGKSFLWADDLAAYDSILNLPFEIPFYGAHVSGFTLLMAGSMFFYMNQNMAQQAAPTQPGMPDMRIMMRIMPLFMLFFFNKYASGLSLYYFMANVVTIGQVRAVKKLFIDEDKIREKIKAKQAAPKEEKKKGGFAQRLETMQQEQQKRAEEMKKQRDQDAQGPQPEAQKVSALAHRLISLLRRTRCAAICHSSPSVQRSANITSRPRRSLFAYTRTMCFGPCPAFTLEVQGWQAASFGRANVNIWEHQANGPSPTIAQWPPCRGSALTESGRTMTTRMVMDLPCHAADTGRVHGLGPDQRP